uniref:Kinetoplast DNA minicircle pLURk9 n=1 Tax=Leishmania sp. TaxID=28847 RepID=Q33606_9TRYP|nr:unnamed protein product [Leishmania sp.]
MGQKCRKWPARLQTGGWCKIGPGGGIGSSGADSPRKCLLGACWPGTGSWGRVLEFAGIWYWFSPFFGWFCW